MPRFVLTLHAYGSWLADKDEGWTDRRKKETQAPSLALGQRQRLSMAHDERRFSPKLQRVAAEALLAAAAPLHLRVWAIGTCATHVHPLVGWRDDREATAVRRSLKRSVSLGLKAAGAPLPFLAGGGNLRRVLNEESFAFFREKYLPDHPGWFWDRDNGWREPRAGGWFVPDLPPDLNPTGPGRAGQGRAATRPGTPAPAGDA